jgi:hypothetical protein
LQTQRWHELQPIRKSKSHSFSEKNALQAVLKLRPAYQRSGGWSSFKLFYGKARAKFPKSCEKQKESVEAKEAHGGEATGF